MSVKYTDGAKVFIGAVLVSLAILLVIICRMTNGSSQVKRDVYKVPEPEVKCVDENKIGYLNTMYPRDGLKLIYDSKSSAICLKRVQEYRWSIHKG